MRNIFLWIFTDDRVRVRSSDSFPAGAARRRGRAGPNQVDAMAQYGLARTTACLSACATRVVPSDTVVALGVS